MFHSVALSQLPAIISTFGYCVTVALLSKSPSSTKGRKTWLAVSWLPRLAALAKSDPKVHSKRVHCLVNSMRPTLHQRLWLRKEGQRNFDLPPIQQGPEQWRHWNACLWLEARNTLKCRNPDWLIWQTNANLIIVCGPLSPSFITGIFNFNLVAENTKIKIHSSSADITATA